MRPIQNGHTPGPGSKDGPHTQSQSQRKVVNGSSVVHVVSVLARLLLWYSVYVVAFQCPADLKDLTDDSPGICRPYINARDYTKPYVQPYYDIYAAPYVNKTRPYLERVNEHVYAPILSFTQQSYETHAAPHVKYAKEIVYDYWKSGIQPHIKEYQNNAKEKYGSKIAPHIERASSIVMPHIERTKYALQQKYHNHLLPTYTYSMPHLRNAYALMHKFAFDIVVPYTRDAWSWILTLIERKLVPKARVLYGENVEPQLVRIGERLGRYQDGQSVKPVAEEVDTSFSSSSMSSSAHSLSSMAPVHSSVTYRTTLDTPDVSSKPSEPLTAEQEAAQVRETVKNDLRAWQEKFTKAADKGMESLGERIEYITEKQINTQVHGVGVSLLTELDETIQSEVQSLDKKILGIVGSLPESLEEEDYETVHLEISTIVRGAGMPIKDKAQAIRYWQSSYDKETNFLVESALDSTLDVLDEIRDLGLQELGMRWAWMEGVTYDDWSKYHKLKTTFAAWRGEIKNSAHQNPGLENAKIAGDEVLAKGMSLAENAAKELQRLKEFGLSKLRVKDTSEDFDTQTTPAFENPFIKPTVEVCETVNASLGNNNEDESISFAEKLNDVAPTISTSASEAFKETDDVSSTILAEASEASSRVVHKTPFSKVSKEIHEIASEVLETISELSDVAASASSSGSTSASSKVWGGAMAQAVTMAEPIMDDSFEDDSDSNIAQDRYSAASKAVSEALLGSSSAQGNVESVASLASEQYSRALEAASRALYGTSSDTADAITSIMPQQFADAVSAASSVIYDAPTPVFQSLVASASSVYGDAFSKAQEKYARAMSGLSSQIYGTQKPAHEELVSSIENAYTDSLSTATAQLQSALNAASNYVWPTQAPLESISSIASAKLQEGLIQASAAYENAKASVMPTPTPKYHQYILDAQRRYYEAVGYAHNQYSVFVSSASSAIMGLPTPAYQSMYKYMYNAASDAIYGTQVSEYRSLMDKAQSQYCEATAAASSTLAEVLASASAAASPTSTGPAQNLLYSASAQYYNSISRASTSLSSASVAASIAIYGTPKPAYQSLIDAAQHRYNDAVAAASSNLNEVLASAGAVVGVTSKSQNVLEAASSRYNSAVSRASASLADAVSSASLAVYGKSTDVGHHPLAAAGGIVDSENAEAKPVGDQVPGHWEELISKASEQVYQATPPWHESLYSRADEYASRATNAATEQYQAIHDLISELLDGKDPDFTESVMSRFSSAYYTGYPVLVSSVSSYGSDVLASATSAVESIVTSPPTVESILESAKSQVNAAVEEVSVQLFGTSKGQYEKATSAVADSYNSLRSRAGEAVYGGLTQTGYVEAARDQIQNVVASARSAVSTAIYGTTTGGAHEAYSSIHSRVSSAVYGTQESAMESAQSRLSIVVESARTRLSELASLASDGASGVVEAAQSSVKEFASSIAAAPSSSTSGKSKDEL